MASKVATACCNVGYDVLTIFISIADVTTDIIVLIDFYNKERMTFFGISLTILILAHCSYAMACAVKFDTIDNWKPWTACAAFCCLLPFGTFVAFCMYFGTEESGCYCFESFLSDCLELDTNRWFNPNYNDSKMVKWIRKKLEKHLGFILEAAIEAFPQSLLQIVAIVYYQEANFVAIISISLSMFSVISKSLILSQGIDKYTFIWTWLCVVTDFFGIFFTLIWVFYAHDSIHGDFLGYFNIFGEIWIWKFAISTLLPVVFALVIFFGVAYWFLFCALLYESSSKPISRCGWGCLWLIFGPIIAILCAFGACLGCEVFCFSLLAVAVYIFGTDRISESRSDHTANLATLILNFISKGRDKRLRILSINKGLEAVSQKKCKTVCNFIDNTLESDGINGLKKITYADIRQNCANPEVAALFVYSFCRLMDYYKYLKRRANRGDAIDRFFNIIHFVGFSSLLFWVIPVLIFSKLLQILFPWFIVAYLGWNTLLFTNEIDLFQMVMLMVSIGLQLVIFLLGIHVFKINWYLWHIEPGSNYVYWGRVQADALNRATHKFYDNVCWYPQVEMIVLNCFLGSDVGKIIMDYCKNIQCNENLLLP